MIKHYFRNDPYQVLSYLSGSIAALQTGIDTRRDNALERPRVIEIFVLLSLVVSSQEQTYKKTTDQSSCHPSSTLGLILH